MKQGNTRLLEEKRLDLSALRNRISNESFEFETTAEIDPLVGTVGQERAL